MLFVSLKVKKNKKILMEKKASKGKQKYAQQGIQAAHRILVSFLRRDKRSMRSFYLLLRIGYWYLFFEGIREVCSAFSVPSFPAHRTLKAAHSCF